MKLRHLFLLFTLLVYCTGKVLAQSGTEKITISFHQITLKEATEQIGKVSDYTFSYDATKINLKTEVSLDAKDEEVRLAIRRMLEPTDITFRFQKKEIQLLPKTTETVKKGREVTIHGSVVDGMGEPIIGGSVLVKGTVNGMLTDFDGKYSITAKVGDVLEFRYIGYTTVEKQIKNNAAIDIVMEEANQRLDEVVVVGYGTQKKESVVSSVNSVKPGEIARPTRSLTNAIAGQIAGVITVQRSGEPGQDDASFWIRGISSYKGGTNPLVLVDGVPRSMSDIDVDEVESFTVLKDAAATAVYGSEGANGVVLITTKRGLSAKTKISFSAQYTMVSPTRMPKIMPAYDYLAMWNEAVWNDAGNPDIAHFAKPYSDEELAKYRSGEDTDLYPNTDWMGLLANTTTNQRYNINIRGGGEKARFFISGAFFTEDGIFKSQTIDEYDANISLNRYNLRSNVDLDVTSTTKLGIDLSLQNKMRNTPAFSSDAIFRHIVLFPTHLLPFQWSDGTASARETDADGRYNPYNLINRSGYLIDTQTMMQSKVTLKQQLDFILKGLSVQASLSFDTDMKNIRARNTSPDKWAVTGRDENGVLIKKLVSAGKPLSDFTVTETAGKRKTYIEGQINYKHTFNKKHDMTTVVVYNQQEESSLNVVANLLPFRKQNIVARGSYAYDGRYVLEASCGATGSENFADNHRWGLFPAMGLAWNMHAEKFMQKEALMNVLSKSRLRASFGYTGNSSTGGTRFPYREQLTQGGGANLGLKAGADGGATNGTGGVYEGNFAAEYLTWEKERKINVGVDLGLFRGRVDITADYFTNRRTGILVQRITIPSATGFRSNPWQNMGIVVNKGFDSNITIQEKVGGVNLTARGNFTYAKNKIIEQDEIPQAYPWLEYTGRSIGQPKLYIAQGLFTPDDFDITENANGSKVYKVKKGVATYSNNVMPGDIKYKDLNDDGKIDDNDRSYDNAFHSSTPEIVYGFGLNAEYKGFSAGVFFQGVAQASVNMNENVSLFNPFSVGRDESSARIEAHNHWRAEDPYNQNVLYPRLHASKNANNTLASTWWYRDASYLRLKNVEFGYQFNKDLLKSIRMISDLRVFVQGTNLVIWDKVKMWDPELKNSGSKYPICGTWTLGLDIKF